MELDIEKGWKTELKKELDSAYFDQLKSQINQEIEAGHIIYPSKNLIFNAFNLCPLTKVKVVILGQDPYHGAGEAMGLCFSVPRGIKIPPSLRNIYKEIKIDLGHEPPSHGDLSSWAKQGVLLLNSILTVRHKEPASHKKIGWSEFTDAVIKTLSAKKSDLVFLLWGGFAKSKISLIDQSKHHVLSSVHPSPFTGNQFFENHHFSQTNALLARAGKQEINWKIEN